MPIARNRNTTQQPNLLPGRTGTQSIKVIPAPRVYVKTADFTNDTPVQEYFTKSNGVTPTGWTDLGIVDGNATITYTKKTTDVKTGIDNYLRATYISEKSANINFTLGQFDDIAIEQISSLTASVITSGSIVNYQFGQDEITTLALLLVVQNKLDSKEWQFYNPAALINFTIDNTNNAMSLKVTSELPFFTAAGTGGALGESLLSVTEFA